MQLDSWWSAACRHSFKIWVRPTLRLEIGLKAKGKKIMKTFVGLAAFLFAISVAVAQNAKSPAPAKSHASTGCKFVGTVKGTKLWAGDCTDAAGLRGSNTAPQSLPAPGGAAIPPAQKQD